MAPPSEHLAESTAAPAGRFSGRVQTLQWVDRRAGVPACAVLTFWRRLSSLLGGDDNEATPRKILFLKLAEQGSTVLAYEAVRRAVAKVGRENVYFFVFEENRFVVDLLGLVPPENVLTVRTGSLGAMIASALAALRTIRRARIDACVDMEFFARSSAVLAYLTGARVRVGFHSYFGEGPYRGNLLTHRVLYNARLHTSATFTSLVDALDCNPAQLPVLPFRAEASTVPPLFAPKPEEMARVRALLAELGVPVSNRLILLNANAGDLLPLRKWPEQNYVTLARRALAASPDVSVAFTGAAEEAGRIAELVRAVGSPRAVCVAGRTTLRELLALYGVADVLVTNDSGPAHFAALTEIDCVALFGPETPELFAALGPRSHSLTAGLACSPCVNALNNRQTTCRDNRCMQAISVDEVFALVQRLLRERAPRPAHAVAG